MPGYTKLFGSILASTIWNEPAHVKVVWITMLAMCDQDGVVEASVPGLAVMARVDRTLCEQAISVLSAPDPDSRTKTDEGRRIAPVKGGWHVLNYEAYRDKQTAEEAKAKKSARQARWRARHPGHVDAEETPETQRDAGSREETHSEAEASAKAASKAGREKTARRVATATELLFVHGFSSRLSKLGLIPPKLGLQLRNQLVKWIDATAAAAQKQEPVAAFVERWLDNAFADPRFQAAGYPPGWLRQNPNQYLQPPTARKSSWSPVGDFSNVEASDPLTLFAKDTAT